MTLRERLSRPEAVAVAALIAFAILRTAALTRYPFWADESWTMDMGVGTLRAVLVRHADDQTHPPLFFAMLWAWRRIGGDALPWVRLLPWLAGVATAIPMAMAAREARFTLRATALAVMLGAGSGFLVSYSAELRNYALLAFLGTVSIALWIGDRDHGSRWTRLMVVNTLLVYTHYFGVFVVFAEWIDALGWARRRLRAMTISAAVSALFLAPWIGETVRRARITGGHLDVVSWIPMPVVGNLLDLPIATFGTTPWPVLDVALVAAATAAIGVWAWRARRMEQAAAIRTLALAVAVPVAVIYLGSLLGPRPLWVTRYLIMAAPPLLLLTAGAIDALVPARLTALAALLAAIPAALTVRSLARGEEKPRYDLVVQDIVRLEPGPSAAVYSAEGTSVRYTIQRDSARLARPVKLTFALQPALVTADSGWYLWSETHPPRGVPPEAALIRSGYRLGPLVQAPSDIENLMAIRFRRAKASP